MERAERIASVILVLFGLFVAYYSRQYLKLGLMIRPDAGFLPYCIGIALTVLGAIWFFMTVYPRKAPIPAVALRRHGDAAEGDESRRKSILYRFVPGVLLVILYAWLMEKIGYIPSTALFMVGWQKGVEREGWLKTLIIAGLCAGGMYILFSHFLKVALPTGTWLS